MKLPPEKQKKLAIVVAAFALASGLLYFFLIRGLQAVKEGKEKEVSTLEEKIKKQEAELLREKNNKAAAADHQVAIKGYVEKMPPRGSNVETWLNNYFTTMADHQTPKITISTTPIEQLRDATSFRFSGLPYSIVSFRFTFRAEFEQIGRFLEEIENGNPLMEVDDVTITSGSDVPHIHTVAVKVSMVTQN